VLGAVAALRSNTTKLLGALIAFVLEAALQVSGYSNPTVAMLLVGIAGVLFVFWLWDEIRALRAWRVARKSTAWAARDRLGGKADIDQPLLTNLDL
jgi:hypothetical protein